MNFKISQVTKLKALYALTVGIVAMGVFWNTICILDELAKGKYHVALVFVALLIFNIWIGNRSLMKAYNSYLLIYVTVNGIRSAIWLEKKTANRLPNFVYVISDRVADPGGDRPGEIIFVASMDTKLNRPDWIELQAKYEIHLALETESWHDVGYDAGTYPWRWWGSPPKMEFRVFNYAELRMRDESA